MTMHIYFFQGSYPESQSSVGFLYGATQKWATLQSAFSIQTLHVAGSRILFN